jgi:hypothetical protein
MPVTVLVEPDGGGHRFQAVANVARFAGRTDDILLLTSSGATDNDRFRTFLGGVDLEVDDRLDGRYPATRDLASAVAAICRTHDVSRVVVMEADQFIKRWWYLAPPRLRGLPRRPQVIFFVNRYPTRIRLGDPHDWVHRVSKAGLALLGLATGALQRVGCFAGREDMSTGLLLKRVRDPAVCSAHSRDRVALRGALGLAAQRRLVSIVGIIDARKCVQLVFEAVLASGPDSDLLLAGTIDPEIADWLAGLDETRRARIVLREGFLADDVLDQLVATSDVVVIAQLNKGPSGIMGKALAAEVPVVTAGSVVRASEVRGTKGGLAADLTAPAIAEALRAIQAQGDWGVRADAVPLATADAFAGQLLGTRADGTPLRQLFSRRPRS